jgi:hypothetical protein
MRAGFSERFDYQAASDEAELSAAGEGETMR